MLVAVHSITLWTGLAGHLTVAGAALALGIALVAAVALAWRARSADGGSVQVAAPAATPFVEPAAPTAVLFLASAALVALVAWAWPHLVHATRLWVWDDYTYHMVYPARWLADGAIAAATPAEAFTMQAWYPLSASVVSAWLMLPFHGVRADALAWVSLTGVLYAGLVASGAAELLARLGAARGAWALPVVLLVTSDRIAVMASSFSDADLAQAAALFGAFVFAVPRGDVERRRGVTVDMGYAALLSGIALGIKVSAVPQALIVLLMTTVRAAGPAWSVGALTGAAVRSALVFGAGWAVTAGYWYVRNVVHTGNPVYPAAFVVWPGATFPETTLAEYAGRYGLRRAVGDALTVYLNWPVLHAVLAVTGLAGLVAWSALRRRSATRPRRYFAWGALAIAAVTVILLPAAPYSAGNALTFRAGFVHWDSMRYVALLPILGWTALGFLVDPGRTGPSRWRTVAAIALVLAAVLTPASSGVPWGVTLLALAVAAAILVPRSRAIVPWTLRAERHAAIAIGAGVALLFVFVAATHPAKADATRTALHREPLFGAAAAVLDRQPPSTRVAVFGDQWIYPAFGDRTHLRPIRLDRDGRVATAPIAAAMEPGDLTVPPPTFRENLRASAIDLVVLVRQPHPGRPSELPPQHAALEAIADAQLLHRDRAVAIWRLGR